MTKLTGFTIACMVAISFSGCEPANTSADPVPINELDPATSVPDTDVETDTQPKVAEEVPLEAEVETWEPKVSFSEAHLKSCLAKVGDEMPPFELADLEGTEQSLTMLLGDQFTIAVFWQIGLPFAEEQYLDLGYEFYDKYGTDGVSIIAINVGDKAEEVSAKAKEVDAKFSNLLDTNGGTFGKVATETLPRTYLLDPIGEILWMDIGYSRSTRRELHNAIRFYSQK